MKEKKGIEITKVKWKHKRKKIEKKGNKRKMRGIQKDRLKKEKTEERRREKMKERKRRE